MVYISISSTRWFSFGCFLLSLLRLNYSTYKHFFFRPTHDFSKTIKESCSLFLTNLMTAFGFLFKTKLALACWVQFSLFFWSILYHSCFFPVLPTMAYIRLTHQTPPLTFSFFPRFWITNIFGSSLFRGCKIWLCTIVCKFIIWQWYYLIIWQIQISTYLRSLTISLLDLNGLAYGYYWNFFVGCKII